MLWLRLDVFKQDFVGHADFAVVLGSEVYEAACRVAAGLFRQGRIETLVLTGGVNRITGRNEARSMFTYCKELGIPEQRILIEPCARSTIENLLFSRELLIKEGGLGGGRRPVIVVVSKSYQSGRARLIAESLFKSRATIMSENYLSPVFGISRENWFTSLAGMKAVIVETIKLNFTACIISHKCR
jgi:uncharacterized SAM-binding protein YcdF (DUF218 family)